MIAANTTTTFAATIGTHIQFFFYNMANSFFTDMEITSDFSVGSAGGTANSVSDDISDPVRVDSTRSVASATVQS